ncbi:FUSC family protein [Acidobacteria bacterium AB60]|nr:FUSC family protein [Acidobacteria bacterium AB60]
MRAMASPADERPCPDPPGVLAATYTFQWCEFKLRLPLVSALAVAVCLFIGIFVGHPAAGLIAGGGAFTVGFGSNQRISDSRLIPMFAGILATSTAAFAGTVVGHRDYWLLLAAAGSAAIYGVLSTRNAGVAWVGQQAFVFMIVASAFPSELKGGLQRGALVAAGGLIQLLFTSAALRLIPDLHKDFVTLASSVLNSVYEEDWAIAQRLRNLPSFVPALSRHEAFGYSLRLILTSLAATEVYRRWGVQSGYWIPMTALLVQRPAALDTAARVTSRIVGTIAGAWLGSLFIAHVAPRPEILAAITSVFALLAFATNAVNYALFTATLTGYIVFLLSLNVIPGSVIAHRRMACTALGGLIAVVFHADALLRLRRSPSQQEAEERAA